MPWDKGALFADVLKAFDGASCEDLRKLVSMIFDCQDEDEVEQVVALLRIVYVCGASSLAANLGGSSAGAISLELSRTWSELYVMHLTPVGTA